MFKNTVHCLRCFPEAFFYNPAPLAVRTPTSNASLFFGRKTKYGDVRISALEPVTPSVRNIVALLRLERLHRSVFLPAHRPLFLALANIVGLLAWSASQSSVFAHSNLSLFPPSAALRDSPHRRREGVSQLTAAAHGFCNHAAAGVCTACGTQKIIGHP